MEPVAWQIVIFLGVVVVEAVVVVEVVAAVEVVVDAAVALVVVAATVVVWPPETAVPLMSSSPEATTGLPYAEEGREIASAKSTGRSAKRIGSWV